MVGADVVVGIVAGCAVAVFLFLVVLLVRSARAEGRAAAQLAQMTATGERLALAQAELAGRLDHGHASLGDRLEQLSQRLGDGLIRQTERTQDQLRLLHERLAVIDTAQATIGELTLQVGGLANLLSNKQARGAFGEVQLEELIRAVLPPAAYAFQVTLGNGNRVDALLKLPEPPGPIAIDAKFPLESYRALRAAAGDAARVEAGRAFAHDIRHHVRAIADKYLVPGETADSALLFLPSEAIYAELHANFGNVVAESFRRKVWIVSPTTLWATLNTLRAVLRDVRLREEAQQLQTALAALLVELDGMAGRLDAFKRHFRQAGDDLGHLAAACERAMRQAAHLDLDRLAAADAPVTPAPAGGEGSAPAPGSPG